MYYGWGRIVKNNGMPLSIQKQLIFKENSLP
jgi:hypothetical protein